MTQQAAAVDPPLPAFSLREAVLPTTGATIWVIFDHGHGIHEPSSAWLRFMMDKGNSPNTVRAYGTRVAWYLSWSAATGRNWREPTISDLAEWKTNLRTTPYSAGKELRLRDPQTVDRWMIATTEFYKWAAANGVVSRDSVDSFFDLKYVPPGPHGGESGRTVRARVPELAMSKEKRRRPQWLEDADQRAALMHLGLSPRDRFLVDMLYSTGMRGGEALSLFREDLHFVFDNTPLGCAITNPHVHVKRNPTQNKARVKASGGVAPAGRWVPVPAEVVHSYERYRSERVDVLGHDENPHVFVNLHNGVPGDAWTADSMTDLFRRMSRRLGFYLRPHMLRHTRATLWLRGIECRQLQSDTVQVLLGHASPQSTAVYTHSTKQDLRDAVDGMALRNGRGEDR